MSAAAAEYFPDFIHQLVLGAAEHATVAANAPTRPSLAPVGDHDRVLAMRRDDSPYPGDFVGDVIRYRELRARSLAGDCVSTDELDELARLEAGLRQPREGADDESALRSFYRFDCDFQAEIRAGVVRQRFAIGDISAGGVKASGTHRFTPGDVATLVFDRAGHGLAFPARVAWVRGDTFGLMFAGAPRAEHAESAR